jgi:hypothetical protein
MSGDDNGKKRKNITHQQFYQLCSWLQANAERLMREKPKYAEAAVQAEEELGFAVSSAHTLKEAMDTTHVLWDSPAPGGPIKREEAAKLAELAQRTTRRVDDLERLHGEDATKAKRLEADVAWLRALVHHLYRKLGEKPPQGYVLPPFERDIQLVPGGDQLSHPSQTVSRKGGER